LSPSTVNTITVPTVGSQNVATLMKAAGVPLRVVVRNVAGTPILIAHDTNVLQNSPAVAGTFLLTAGQTEVFVLAPQQGLFAASSGAGGTVSIAVSDAIAGSFGA